MLDHLVGNPLHVYSFLERQVKLLPKLLQELQGEGRIAAIEKRVKMLLNSIEMPTELDLEGAAQALARIQFAYRINPIELAEGRIMNVQTKARLSAEQMMDIARRRISGSHPMRPRNGREYALAIEWAEAALEIVKEDGNSIFSDTILEFLQDARAKHDKFWPSPLGQKGTFPNEEFFVERVDDHGKISFGKELRERETQFLRKFSISGYLRQGFDIHDFYALCRGDILENKKQYQGTCLYTNKNDPFFFLSPLKKEILSEEPPLHIYHGILTSKEMEFLTSRIIDKLENAAVQDTSIRGGGGSKLSHQ